MRATVVLLIGPECVTHSLTYRRMIFRVILMPDPRMADLITTHLASGLLHPGNPENDKPPWTIMLPFRSSPGMPKEMVEQLNVTAKAIGEAIIHLIETEGQSVIVSRDELARLRYTQDQAVGTAAAGVLPVHCRCDRNYSDPLMYLTVDNTERVVINGRQLLKGLAGRSVDCPHTRVTT